MVVGVGVRNVYLRNRPDQSSFGPKKGGKFEFCRWRRYIEAAVLVRVLPVFGCQVLPGGDQVLPDGEKVLPGCDQYVFLAIQKEQEKCFGVAGVAKKVFWRCKSGKNSVLARRERP